MGKNIDTKTGTKGEKLLIALQGSSNSGKTSVLRTVIDLVLSDNHALENMTGGRYISSKDTNWRDIGNVNILPRTIDRTIAVEFSSGDKKITIGIATGGDDTKIIEDNLIFFEKYNCDIMILATKSSGASVVSLHERIDAHEEIIFIPVFKTRSREQHDRILAEEIYTVAKCRWNEIRNDFRNVFLNREK